LTQHRDALEKLVQALMEHETINQEEMEALIGPRP
jgi:ATP-dependent Zn protease